MQTKESRYSCKILGDKAFPIGEFCIPPHKKPRNGELDAAKKEFNLRHSTARVAVEHFFGLLKTKWQGLQFPLAAKVFEPYHSIPPSDFRSVCMGWWQIHQTYPGAVSLALLLLTNCLVILGRNNSIRSHFGLSPPTLVEYVGALYR